MEAVIVRDISLTVENESINVPIGTSVVIHQLDANDFYFEWKGRLIQILRDDYAPVC